MFLVLDQKLKGQGHTMLRQEVCHNSRMKGHTNFERGTDMEHTERCKQ